MVAVNLDSPADFMSLHNAMDDSELIKNGQLSIEKLTCKNKGNATIICEDENQKGAFCELLESSSFTPK